MVRFKKREYDIVRTDRVLWSTETGSVEQKFYTRREILISDHRPVVAYFVVQVKKIDQIKKEIITRSIYTVRVILNFLI